MTVSRGEHKMEKMEVDNKDETDYDVVEGTKEGQIFALIFLRI